MSAALHLVAYAGGTGILLDARAVDSVVDIGAVVPAPGASRGVRGLAALRSRVITVLDTWHLLGVEPPAVESNRAVVTAVDGHLYAILVDSLEDVATLDVAPVAAGLSLGARWAAIATGTADRDGEPMLVVDLAGLVRAADRPLD